MLEGRCRGERGDPDRGLCPLRDPLPVHTHFCHAADPESKGIVEHLVGYAKRDLVLPDVDDLAPLNAVCVAWCVEVNEFNLAESSIPKTSHDYLVTLDWIGRADNVCLVGPAGTGKTHCET